MTDRSETDYLPSVRQGATLRLISGWRIRQVFLLTRSKDRNGPSRVAQVLPTRLLRS